MLIRFAVAKRSQSLAVFSIKQTVMYPENRGEDFKLKEFLSEPTITFKLHH